MLLVLAPVAAAQSFPPTAPPPSSPPSSDVTAQGGAASLRPAPAAGEPTSTTMPSPDPHERADTNAPSILTAVAAPKKQAWEAAHGGFLMSRFAIARRLAGRPGQLLVPRGSLPSEPEAFLWRVARDTWSGIMAYTDVESGLAVDNVRIAGGLVPPLSLRIGDYTNITSIGLQLAAIAAARNLGLVEAGDAHAQVARILDTLSTLDRYAGLFFNYYDTTSLEPTSSFLSFVDTAWLVAGLVVARQAFPDLRDTADRILEPIHLGRFHDDETGLMSHGYYVHLDALSIYEYGQFYTEARLGSLLAIGKGDAPESHWYAMKRATRARCTGGDCPELHELRYANAAGREMKVAHFAWRSHEYVPSWGGSMFEALMPSLVLDEQRHSPRGLGPNGQAHAILQRLHATEVLGLPVWGMSPCISPASGRYREFGVAGLGSHGYDEAIVTPHAAALALAVTPDDAAAVLMELARRYDIYGPFGFYDAVDPRTGRVAYDQLALDQLMLFLAVANHLSGGEVPELFARDPWVQDALPLLAEERFFD